MFNTLTQTIIYIVLKYHHKFCSVLCRHSILVIIKLVMLEKTLNTNRVIALGTYSLVSCADIHKSNDIILSNNE